MRLNLGTLAVLVVLLCWMAYTAGQTPWTTMRWVGVAITLPSVILLGIARLQLGRSFSIKNRAHKLVTTGMYRYLRHPVYAFGGLTIVGVTLYFKLPWLLLAIPLLVPLQYIRSRKEEALLMQEFGDEYKKYLEQTWL